MREDSTNVLGVGGAGRDAGEAVWHVAVAEGQTQGPYTAGELSGLRRSGTIQDAMLVWRDGWPDWRPLGEVDEILAAPPLDFSAAPTAAGGSNGYDVAVSMGDDPFEAPGAGFAPLTTSAGANSAPASMGADPFSTGEMAAKSPRVSAAEAMTAGQSREGTVEINLAEFRRLSASSTGTASGLVQATSATREDSGLIDVRTAAQLPFDAGAAKPAVQVIGIPTGAGLEAPRRPLEFKTKVMLSVAALAGVLTLVVGVVALTRDSPEEIASASQPTAPSTAASGAVPSGASTASPAPTPEPTPVPEGEAAAAAAAAAAAKQAENETDDEAVEEDDEPEPAPRSGRRSRRRSRTTSTKGESTKSESAPAAKQSGGDSIDDLLGRALEGGGKRPAAKESEASSSSLSDTPSRAQVISAMNGVKGKVDACDGSGVATAKTTVKGSTGRVTDVSVSGVSGSAKSCVERAVKGARFPKFKQASFTVSYPFRL